MTSSQARPTIHVPAEPDPVVSIVVLATRDAARLARCLSAVARHAPDEFPCETIVVLNAADADVRGLLDERVRGARVVTSEVNAGTAASWNHALEGARGRWIHILHEDTEPHEGWLEPLVDTLRGHPDVAVAGSRLHDPDGRLQSNGWTLWVDATATHVDEDSAPGVGGRTEPLAVDFVSSASLLVSRRLLVARGGFDERYWPAGYVEIDLCADMWARGHAVLSVPASRVTHASGAMVAEGADEPLASAPFREFLRRRHRALFAATWPDHVVGRPELRFDDFPGLTAGVLREIASRRELAVACCLDEAPLGPWADRDAWTPGAQAEESYRERLLRIEREFLRWLLSEYERTSVQLAALTAERDRDIPAVQAIIASRDAAELRVAVLDRDLRDAAEHIEARSQELQRIHQGRWWRLRVIVLRVMGRGRR